MGAQGGGRRHCSKGFSDFAIPAKSISAFRRAESMFDALAMANLGFKLLNSGFIEEASQLAKKALGIEAYHSNVTDLLKRLKEAPDEEERIETQSLEK
jgi:hypothetical protein